MNAFLAELRRRNVVRVALAYLAVAWLVIQLVNEIGGILGAPEGFSRLVLVLLAVGFVITVILSWVYEITDHGIRTTGEVDRDASLRPIDGRKLDFFIIGTLLLALGYFVWESRFAPRSPGAAPADQIQSIAVLPFRDLSADHSQEYFAEGMAEELLNALTRLSGLRVAGRTSSFAFRNRSLPPEEIAAELGVGHLLEGSVRSSGQDLRVTAQLIDASNGFQLWSEEFEGTLEDVFAMQDEIAAGVVAGLKLHLPATQPAAPSTRPTTDPATYDEYLLARYHLARRTGDGIRKAIQHFETALQHDPGYAPAHAGLAKSLAISPYYTHVAAPAEIASRVRREARRAIAIEPGNSEAYAALGTVDLAYDRNWEQAARNLSRAVELNPNDAGNVNLYGDYLYTIGDYVGALEYEGRAAELEPLSAANRHELALVLNFLGHREDALEAERKAVHIGPEFRNAWDMMIRMLIESGRLQEAEALLEDKASLLGPRTGKRLRVLLALESGDPTRARELAGEVLRESSEAEYSATQVAFLFARLGDDERAAELAGRAYREGDPILVSPLYFFLPEDYPGMPRLQAALARPGLAELYDLRRINAESGRGRRLPESP